MDGIDAAGNRTTITPPLAVRLAEGRLVDDMPALSSVALGPTGRSVARSYEAALSKLCPTGESVMRLHPLIPSSNTRTGLRVGTTIGVDANDDDPGEKRYRKAMSYLTEPHPSYPGKTRVDVYTEKQKAYTTAFERKTEAFQAALDLAKADVRNHTIQLQREAYGQWVAKNAKTYRALMQAAYMDWVTNGKKEEVEYWFGVVDSSSAMARVEASKVPVSYAEYIVHLSDRSISRRKPCVPAWFRAMMAPLSTILSILLLITGKMIIAFMICDRS